MIREKVVPGSVTLYGADWATLQQIGKDYGLASSSASLRWLINDWKKMKLRETIVTAEYRTLYSTEQSR